MTRNAVAYILEAFRPLIESSGKTYLAPLLRTKDLAEDRKAAQFAKFNGIKFNEANVCALVGGGFIAEADFKQKRYILISSPWINEDDQIILSDDSRNLLNINEVDFDEGFFIWACGDLRDHLMLKEEYRSALGATNFLDIVDEKYSGHDISELMSCYRTVFAYEITENCPYIESNFSDIALDLLWMFSFLRPKYIDQLFADSLIRLKGLYFCPPDNLLNCLNAGNWKHVFLDLYRFFEALFFFPWMYKLKMETNTFLTAASLAKFCEDNLSWKSKESDSMCEIFEMVDSQELNHCEAQIVTLVNAMGAAEAKRGALGKKVYFHRNSLVHLKDREVKINENLSMKDWRDLSLYLTKFFRIFHEKYKEHLTIN